MNMFRLFTHTTLAIVLFMTLPSWALQPNSLEVQTRQYVGSGQSVKVKYVSLKEFEKLKGTYKGRAIEVAQTDSSQVVRPAGKGHKQPKPPTPPPRPRSEIDPDCRGVDGPSSASDDQHSGSSDSGFYVNWMQNTSFDDGKDVLIFFAVIGVVVVAALVVYSVGFLWKTAARGFKCKTWSQWALRYSYITDTNSKQIRQGSLAGLNYTLAHALPSFTFGLVAEVGHFDMDLEVVAQGANENFNGPYFLLGPKFHFPISGRSLFFNIEVLGGTTTDKEIGLMSTVRFGLDFRMSSSLTMGLSFGGALINVKTFKGVLADIDQVNYLSGVTIGTQF